MLNSIVKDFPRQEILIDRFGRNLLHICVLSREKLLFEILFRTIHRNSFLYVQFFENSLFDLDYNDETPLHLAV